MAQKDHLAALKKSIVDLDFAAVAKAAQEAMAAGVDARTAITDGMVPGMAVVGQKFESGEYFLSELIVAAEVMKEGLKVINPYIKGPGAKKLGKVVIATIQGDNHDIGKNIVSTLLGVQGFEVIDLGTDVSPEKIVKAVEEHRPAVVGLSALLTVTMTRMGNVIKLLEANELRNSVKVIIGGAPITPAFAESIGADHAAANAVEGVRKCAEWIGSKGGR